MRRVHRFLSRRKTQAFTKGELAEAIPGVMPKVFNEALASLAELRAIDVRYVKGQPYYAYLEDLDRVW
jgi:hypothetical protein